MIYLFYLFKIYLVAYMMYLDALSERSLLSYLFPQQEERGLWCNHFYNIVCSEL